MNGVRVLTAKSAESVDHVRRSFLSDRSLSKQPRELFSYLFVIDVVCGSDFGV